MAKMNYQQQRKKDFDFLKKKDSERADMKQKATMYYAGVGSRSTPEETLDLMTRLAEVLREDGFILRSGHAIGADQAFERGARARAQIFLPWPSFNQDLMFWEDYKDQPVPEPPVIFDSPTMPAAGEAALVHPAFDRLSGGAKKLHARNVHQILGYDLDNPRPVEFVICWTPDAQVVGGTATAINLARRHNIPVWNLADEETYDMAFEWAWGVD